MELVEGTKYARKCSVTGEGMNSGYCIGHGQYYAKNDTALQEHFKWKGYAEKKKAYDSGEYYWTDWEIPVDAEYIIKNGKLVKLIIEIRLNCLAPTIAKQLKQQGVIYDIEKVKYLDKLKNGISYLTCSNLINDRTTELAIEKLFMRIRIMLDTLQCKLILREKRKFRTKNITNYENKIGFRNSESH